MTDLSPDDALDASSVVRAAAGDDGAFADLVRRHQRRALRLAFVICGSTEEAEDAVQDAFVKAHGALHTVRPGAPVVPWLMRIVANTARNRRRSGTRRTRVAVRAGGQRVVDPEHDVEDAALASVRDEALLAAVARLGERDRRVIALRWFADLSEAETASVLRVPVGTVKSRTSRALARLQAELEETPHG